MSQATKEEMDKLVAIAEERLRPHMTDKEREEDPYLGLMKQYPHCDQYVLHLPGTCAYCDSPELQPAHDYRNKNNINHTGENNPTKQTCPAEALRSKDIIDKWGGNRATKEKT
jgi:hypothetical protein